jgi:beta-glucanase (GH16 family)
MRLGCGATRVLLASSLGVLVVALGIAAPGSATVYTTSTGTESTSWQLAWSSNFSGAAGTAPSGWTFESGATGNWIEANDEQEYYVDAAQNATTQNAVLDGNGDLAISATQYSSSNPLGISCSYDADSVCPYLSARLDSSTLFDAEYGRIEARIKVPDNGDGIWPAFWSVGADYPTVSWPASGEIDMMEELGDQPDEVYGHIHGPVAGSTTESYGLPPTGEADYTPPGGQPLGAGFHTYGVDWYPDHVSFFIDGHIYATIYKTQMPSGDTWVFDLPFYLILNVAVGGTGSWGGAPNSSTVFPATMLVNWVKVYTSTTPPVPAAGTVTGIDSMCLDDYHSGTSQGNTIDLWTCNNTNAQNWTFATDGTVQAFGRCLDTSGGGTASLTDVVLDACDGAASQQWRIESDGSLENTNSGLCLDDYHSGTTNGNPIDIYGCHGESSQIWTYPIPPTDVWPLTDGSGTTAIDIGDGNDATLAGGATWATDPTRGTVLSVDGATGYAQTSGPVLNTTGSFTVSAWVNLTTAADRNETIVAQDGTEDSAFYLGYNDAYKPGSPGWAFFFPKTDSTDPTWFGTAISDGVTTGTWTMVTGVYDATADTATLYVNGVAVSLVTGVTPYSATGPLRIGADQWEAEPGDFFPGKISDVQVFNQALTATQVEALYTET